MARVDDYRNAKTIAADKLRQRPLADIAGQAGLDMIDRHSLRVPFLNRIYQVDYPAFEFKTAAGPDGDIALQEQVLIMHYLAAGNAAGPAGQWVSYREIPGAAFYHPVFVKRAVNPLKAAFGVPGSDLAPAAAALHGHPVPTGDAGFEFRVFPRVALQLVLWYGDEEFAAEASILFDAGISAYFSPEDVVWLASLLVYRLIGLAGRFKKSD